MASMIRKLSQLRQLMAYSLILTLTAAPFAARAEEPPGGGGGGAGGSGAEPEELALMIVGGLSLAFIAWRQRRQATETTP